MAHIYLDELKEILPGILDKWIDKDDESWEWIFQEIEQKCHVGKKLMKKKQNILGIRRQKMTNEELEKEYKRLKDQFFRLLACLYPNQIGQHDVEYIIGGKKEARENE